jgi:hypothetical protein
MSEMKHTPLPHLTGCYKTPLGLGIYTEPVKDINTPEILCETQELADRVIASVNARPQVEDAIRAANAAEKWRESQREPTLRADEWQGVLAKIRALESALGGKAE